MHENRGPTGDLLPPFYLGTPTSASPHDARARGEVSRQPAASAAPPDRDFGRVSRDTRATSRNGVLGPFKASRKSRLFGGKSRPFPIVAPQTPKHPAGGSIPPISTDSHQSLQLQRYVPRMGTRWVQQNGAGHWKVLLPMVGACLLVTQMSDVISLGGSGTNRSVVPFGSVKRRSSMMRWSLWPQPSAAR